MKESETNQKKQQIQDKEVFLYKPYEVNLPGLKTPEPIFIQDEINNLDKYMKFM